MSNKRGVEPARLLIALGIIGKLLQKEQPVTMLRSALLANDFTSNEISIIFDALRYERFRGIRVVIQEKNSVPHWRLSPEPVES